MRKVIYSAAASLDGYIAGPGEAIDWLRMSEDAGRILTELWEGVDTILMGRKTYDFSTRGGGGGGGSKMKTYIFSRTMTEAPKRAELVREDPAGFVRALKAQPGGNMFILGGGELGSVLIEGGAVDEIGLSVHPLLLGGGVPLFRPIALRVELALVEARAIARDCVFLRYAVVT